MTEGIANVGKNRGVLTIPNPPTIRSWATVVGKKEHDGPLGGDFDLHAEDDRFGMDTWEKAESEMQRLVLGMLLKKSGCREEDIGAVFAGDLLNQCTGSSFGLLDASIPYFGLYGACSTMAEGMMLASMLVGGGTFRQAAAVCSSHFCSAERQFRTPIEYGGQRTPTAQWTVTGAGAVLLSSEGNGPYVTEVLPGISVQKGITDANNMGAAMAPAAIDTLARYFASSGALPDDFDAILTGDLGQVGHDITADMLYAMGYDIRRVYNDCGLMIYSSQSQDVHAGGSGCGCSASVICGHVLKKFACGDYKNILFVGTGALMSTTSVQQGLPIAGIAHLVRISAEKPSAAIGG
ncbi:MAG: stage V sporulation protein AD [Ruminococcaceae bacterium]|nr:stage V sporulation protein AD [Oscillospiraceae bacterium]